jgi:hypothetical protein
MAFKLRAAGITNYLKGVEEREALKQARMDKKEALALELMSKYGASTFAGMSTKSGKGSADTSSLNSDTIYLKDRYKLSNEVLAPIIASGDKTAIPKLKTLLDKQRALYEGEGKVFPEEVINTIMERAVATQPTNKPIDYTEVEKYIGRELDPMLKAVLDSGTTTPGSVTFYEPTFVEQPDFEDLEKFEQRAISSNKARAAQELNSVIKRISTIKSSGEVPAGSDTQAELNWLIDRKQKIDSAISSEAAKIPSYTGYVSLYGSKYLSTLMDVYPVFKDAPLNPTLLSAAQEITSVPNREVARNLRLAGILKDGDEILNSSTGKKFKIGSQ